MNRPDRFWRSIDVLATAYLKGNLEPADPCACAVGNLIAAEKKDASTEDSGVLHLAYWPDHSDYGHWNMGRDLCHPDPACRPKSDIHEIVNCLPYTNTEICLIEKAILTNDEEDTDLFDALMNTVEALFDIHDVEDEDLRNQAKGVFRGEKQYDTVESVLS